ncbi:hypothetical protein FRX31_014716 [Thalictrum thalictroides]|uniref:Uncharacterized protein n=1 Tax=Thalictrum thalictroides TaxID=46969 RepID=A0A7J6WFM0_THATH|nr:hypothetical protein FRX31_014716 [Thalictrum thalictroides]
MRSHCQEALQVTQRQGSISGVGSQWPQLNLTGLGACLWPLLPYSIIWNLCKYARTQQTQVL